VHLVGSAFQPVEEPLDSVIVLAPFNDRLLLRFGQVLEGNIQGNPPVSAKGLEVFELKTAFLASAERLDGSLLKRKGGVGDNEIQVGLNGFSESAARFTGAYRAVEGKEVGERGSVRDPARGTLEAAGEGQVLIRPDPHIDPTAAESEGLLQGIHDPFLIRSLENDAVRDHIYEPGRQTWIRARYTF
jgi:hypothetical protein